MDQNELKKAVAKAAADHVQRKLDERTVIGVGTGSTANCFIDCLEAFRHDIQATVASSEETARRLKALGIPVMDLNAVDEVTVYVDGADETTEHLQLIKGGGGALTREKIVAAASKRFVCIVDDSKLVRILGQFPLPVEVIPMGRSYVARQLVRLGGLPEYREGFVTDNGNVILDVRHLDMVNPVEMEDRINRVAGVVTVGIFARRKADLVLAASDKGVQRIEF